MTRQMSYTEACDRFQEVWDEAIVSREPIEIVQEGTESVTLIATAELQSLLETVYLFQSHENAARLLDAIDRAKAGASLPRTVDSLRQEFGLTEEERASA
jgi:antitoxin YefM